MADKRTLALYWASACGGCEIAVVNLHERLLDVDSHFQIVFCPCLVDAKVRDVAAMEDGSIDITLFNGAVRTEENEEMALLLRRKSRTLVAFGSCAAFGGIPSLSNLSTKEDHFRSIYLDNPSTVNDGGIVPVPATAVGDATIRLPGFLERVKTLGRTVTVDYLIPGCPPESNRIWGILEGFLACGPLPPTGSVLGAGRKSVCEECERTKKDKTVERLRRIHEFAPDPASCLLDQGVVCMGPSTRDGCGALCPQVNMPCHGCYGPSEGVRDQGGKMAGTLGAILDIEPLKGKAEGDIPGLVDERLRGMPDAAGSFYKFTLASSFLAAAAKRPPEGGK